MLEGIPHRNMSSTAIHAFKASDVKVTTIKLNVALGSLCEQYTHHMYF